MPHASFCVPGCTQLRPSGEQQPEQVAESQTQLPLTHFWPTPQEKLAPHAHCPVLVQLSERIGLHVVQARPFLPQARRAADPASAVDVSQTLFWQQPLGQETASQTHAPLTQCWPGPHARPVPQAHRPCTLQPSVVMGSHATHAEPPLPQVSTPRGTHVLPEQHPSGQPAGQSLHTPKLHETPALHCSQARLAAPHALALSLLLGRQVDPAQQPLGQDFDVQVHCPLTHSCPELHGTPAPQRHSPSTQRSAALLHAGPEPQRHSPAAQLSALDGSHRVQRRSLPQLSGE